MLDQMMKGLNMGAGIGVVGAGVSGSQALRLLAEWNLALGRVSHRDHVRVEEVGTPATGSFLRTMILGGSMEHLASTCLS